MHYVILSLKQKYEIGTIIIHLTDNKTNHCQRTPKLLGL